MRDFSRFVRDLPDFPNAGILYRDITPLLGDKAIFREAVEAFAAHYESKAIDVTVGIDARGFILGAALAYRLGTAFVPIRKSGKLPYATYEVTYALEYGMDVLAIHQDAFPKQSRVLLCDDVLATGGTLAASVELIEKLEGELIGIALLAEITELEGREKIDDYEIFTLIEC